MNELVTVTEEQVELVRSTIARDATSAEMRLFLYDCQRQGVHPLDKLIHFTKRGGRYVPITSIDFMRRQAGSTGAYAGADDGVFTGEPGKAGFSCKVVVYRLVQGVRCDWSATARWEEYYPGDAQGQMWRKMPHVMLAKVAEALALRKAFADVLHGLYTREEMDQAQEKPVKDTRSLKEKLGILPQDPTPLVDAVLTAGVVTAEYPPPLDPAETNVGKAILGMFPEIPMTVQPLTHIPQEVQRELKPGPAITGTVEGFPVGKHKGQALDSIPKGYLQWAVANMTNQTARGLAVEELARRAEAQP